MKGAQIMDHHTPKLGYCTSFLFRQKGKSSDNIQLLEGDTLLPKPTYTANVMNEYFTNITSTIGERVSEATLDLDDEEFISLSYDKYKDHPSVNNIAENHQLPSNFEFKEVSTDHVQ